MAYQIERFGKLSGYLDRNSFLRSNFVSVAISQFNAIAAFIAKLTASLFKVGSTPGYPKSITLVCVFGSAPNSVGLAEKFSNLFLTQREPLNQ